MIFVFFAETFYNLVLACRNATRLFFVVSPRKLKSFASEYFGAIFVDKEFAKVDKPDKADPLRRGFWRINLL